MNPEQFSIWRKLVDTVANTARWENEKIIPSDIIDPTARTITIGDFKYDYTCYCWSDAVEYCYDRYLSHLAVKEYKKKVTAALES